MRKESDVTQSMMKLLPPELILRILSYVNVFDQARARVALGRVPIRAHRNDEVLAMLHNAICSGSIDELSNESINFLSHIDPDMHRGSLEEMTEAMPSAMAVVKYRGPIQLTIQQKLSNGTAKEEDVATWLLSSDSADRTAIIARLSPSMFDALAHREDTRLVMEHTVQQEGRHLMHIAVIWSNTNLVMHLLDSVPNLPEVAEHIFSSNSHCMVVSQTTCYDLLRPYLQVSKEAVRKWYGQAVGRLNITSEKMLRKIMISL